MNKIPCEECGGSGTVLDAPADALAGRAYWRTCEDCAGTGQRTAAPADSVRSGRELMKC